MGTEVLRPQDCLVERIRFTPARRKSYGNSNFNANHVYNYHFNPKPNRKPAVRSEKKRFGSGSGSSSENLGMEKVTILRRGGESRVGGEGLVVTGTDRLGPDPDMVRRQIRIVDPRSPLKSKSDVYAGSACAVSPAPSSLPLPSFSKKKQISFDDSAATRDLRRLLRLDL